MSEETGNLFEAIFQMEDIREILRVSAPNHELDDKQREDLIFSLKKIRAALNAIEEKLL